MSMVAVKVAALTGPALDWAVATACGLKVTEISNKPGFFCVSTVHEGREYWTYISPREHDSMVPSYRPRVNWAQGGPLIDRFRVWLVPITGERWQARVSITGNVRSGDTTLESICRCVVASISEAESVMVPAVLCGLVVSA